MANDIDFTDEEEEEEMGGITFKSAAGYLDKPKVEKRRDGRILAQVDKTKYYKAIEKY